MKMILLFLVTFTPLVLQAEKTADKKIVWIDVRTKAEFDSGHVKGALHIPYQKIGQEIHKHVKDKNAQIHVYCKVGGRAGIAKKTLEKNGFKNVTNAGGLKDIPDKYK